MNNQTKTPGAMVPINQSPCDCSEWHSQGMCSHCKRAEQPPAVGGEPKVMRYGMHGNYVCVLPNELDALEAHVAPLLTKIERLNARYLADLDTFGKCQEREEKLNARIAELEAAQGEVAKLNRGV